MSTLIFDFDGTIADTLETVFRITNQLAPRYGYRPTTPEQLAVLQDLNMQQILQKVSVAPWQLPFIVRRLSVELNREIGSIDLIPGMLSVLTQLASDHQLGILTSNTAGNVERFLQNHQIDTLFSFVHTGTRLFGKQRALQRIVRQYDLLLSNTLYIGDETRDVEAAHAVGVAAIAVTWGFNSYQALLAKRPDFLIDRPDQLLPIANQLELPAFQP
ncbi:HAD hydrolase-like protein [Almyronema epifaneia]|uniref:HAD hydrolase-like protein n=1 Tax=Almyronema epifaneia S1 TaxID=2991925 RepID=A0ABW6IHT9_9CYAN